MSKKITLFVAALALIIFAAQPAHAQYKAFVAGTGYVSSSKVDGKGFSQVVFSPTLGYALNNKNVVGISTNLRITTDNTNPILTQTSNQYDVGLLYRRVFPTTEKFSFYGQTTIGLGGISNNGTASNYKTINGYAGAGALYMLSPRWAANADFSLLNITKGTGGASGLFSYTIGASTSNWGIGLNYCFNFKK